MTAIAPDPQPMSTTRSLGSILAERRFDHVLGLRAGNQHVGRDGEVSPVELLFFGDVLRGLAADALVQVAAVVNPGEFGQFVCGMAEQIDALLTERMRQQDFGRQPRNGNSRFLKKLRPLPKRLAYG